MGRGQKTSPATKRMGSRQKVKQQHIRPQQRPSFGLSVLASEPVSMAGRCRAAANGSAMREFPTKHTALPHRTAPSAAAARAPNDLARQIIDSTRLLAKAHRRLDA
eukprot:3720700-Pleurochrysis_carterae.AAC.2